MKKTAQQAYKTHQEQQKANWSTMTTDQQDASLRTEKTLEYAAIMEISDNTAEAEAIADQQALDEQAALIAEMQAKGYSGQGTLEDYQKLYNHPEIFGANWEANSEAIFNQSTGIDEFINLWVQYGKI